ncbi:uncharacterized protein LOC135472112 [Liolophura sinensis]|uniref:uncharacterized protein LOC135472112 n=1 Tax=Liolophura sinensis TaxID=3198878 RepID=UPI0031591D6F
MNNAIRFCRSRGAHVVTVETPEENYFIQVALNNSKQLSRCFMGITDFWSEGEFQTLRREQIPYENFKVPDPDNGGRSPIPENCVCLLAKSGLWKDQACTNTKTDAFVCEKALYHRSSQGLEIMYGKRLDDASCQLESYTVTSPVECAARYLQSGVALAFNVARVLSGTTPNCHVMNCTPMDVSAVKTDPDWILHHYPEIY